MYPRNPRRVDRKRLPDDLIRIYIIILYTYEYKVIGLVA